MWEDLGTDVAAVFARAVDAEKAGDIERALRLHGRCLNLSFRYTPSRERLLPIGRAYRREAAEAAAAGDDARALDRLVRAVELEPHIPEWSGALEELTGRLHPRDLTRQCFTYYDPVRARQIHGDAIRRVLDFVTLGGIVGDVLEFGVLGGWSARLFAETMRDILNLNDLHLFDSFDGLPTALSDVDRNSYEIGGRGSWPERMRFSDAFVEELGESIDRHVASRLATVVRPERIHMHRGYYDRTLARDLPLRAAVVHVDCDLYDSTVQVLQALYRMNALQDGCVLMFDDWNLNKASPRFGERRAFQEFLDGQDQFTASPFFTYGFNGAVFILHQCPRQ